MKTIKATELVKKLNQGEINPENIIDVRSSMERMFGKIANSTHIPLAKISTTTKLKQNQTYYIICASGMRSLSACNELEHQGYQVVNVSGGMSEVEM